MQSNPLFEAVMDYLGWTPSSIMAVHTTQTRADAAVAY